MCCSMEQVRHLSIRNCMRTCTPQRNHGSPTLPRRYLCGSIHPSGQQASVAQVSVAQASVFEVCSPSQIRPLMSKGIRAPSIVNPRRRIPASGKLHHREQRQPHGPLESHCASQRQYRSRFRPGYSSPAGSPRVDRLGRASRRQGRSPQMCGESRPQG